MAAGTRRDQQLLQGGELDGRHDVGHPAASHDQPGAGALRHEETAAPRVACSVDFAHASCAQGRNDLIRPEAHTRGADERTRPARLTVARRIPDFDGRSRRRRKPDRDGLPPPARSRANGCSLGSCPERGPAFVVEGAKLAPSPGT